jgi:hypothetical protein
MQQLMQLIRHSSIIVNPMNYGEYRGLGWRVLTNLRNRDYNSYGSNQWLESFVGFIPSKQIDI